jgi:hypothetical protein
MTVPIVFQCPSTAHICNENHLYYKQDMQSQTAAADNVIREEHDILLIAAMFNTLGYGIIQIYVISLYI